MAGSVELLDLETLPRELELIALAYACDPDDVCVYFLECCWAGDRRIAKAVADMFGLADRPADGISFCRLTAERVVAVVERMRGGPGADWLPGLYRRALAYPRAGELVALMLTCGVGCLPLAEWIVTYFELGTSRDFAALAGVMVCIACGAGRDDVARWLMTEHAGVVSRDSECAALAIVCARGGSLPLARWIMERLAADTALDLRSRCLNALPGACGAGHFDIARWLVERFAVTRAELVSQAGGAMHFADTAWQAAERHTDPALIEWMRARFGEA